MSAQLKHFINTCKDEAKLSFNVWSNAHDDMNLLYVVENELIGKFQENFLSILRSRTTERVSFLFFINR